MALEGDSLEGPPVGPSLFDAVSFFGFAGVDLDPNTFLVEKIDNHNSIAVSSPPVSVSLSVYSYSAEGSVGGGRGSRLPVRIYWTTLQTWAGEETEDERNNLKHILQAFEGEVTSCWVDTAESDGNIVEKIIHTPEELKAALGALQPQTTESPEATPTPEVSRRRASTELVIQDDRNDACINPDAIDESSLKFQTLVDWDGFVFEMFSANRKHAATTTVAAAPMATISNQKIWWRTLNKGYNDGPYNVLSEVWTDEEFQTVIPSLEGDEEILFLRHLAIRLKRFAILTRWRTLESGRIFQSQDRTISAQNIIPDRASITLQRVVSIAGISLLAGQFMGGNPSKMFWRQIPKSFLDGVTTGLVKNFSYLRSMAIWLSCVLAIEAFVKPVLIRTWPLERKSQFVEHLATISIIIQSIGIFLHATEDFFFTLVKVPVVASLKFLSMTSAWWRQREGGITKDALFSGTTQQLLPRKGGNDESYPFWMDAVFFAPVREELVFRFAFDSVWHKIVGVIGIHSVVAKSSSPSLPPAWIWANSLLFGLVHASNWLPVQMHAPSPSGHGGIDDGNHNVWENILGALFQSTSTFLTAFFVFNPLYVQHGLYSSIGAHAALNSVFVGLPHLFRRIVRWVGLETEGEGASQYRGIAR